MQFTPESSAVFFTAILVLVVLAPLLYATARFRFRGGISRVSGYMGGIVGVNIIAVLMFIFGQSILPEDSDKMYLFALTLAAGIVALAMTGDLIFRVRGRPMQSTRRRK